MDGRVPAAPCIVERLVNRLKQCRRVATRYEKLAANYLAMLTLGAIRLWLNPQGRAKTTRASPRGAP
jgi:hypothetical protein